MSLSWSALSVMLPLHAKPGDDIVPLVGWRYVTGWEWSWGAGVPIVVIGLAYLYGVWRLHRRGDRWPVLRTIAWIFGMGWLSIASFSFVAIYDNVLFWVHMVQHMILTMLAGVNIAQAAPVTLLLRTLPPRPHRWLLAVLHSWVAKVLTFPPLTTLAMVVYPFALYPTGLYEYTLRNDLAHDIMHAWMVYIGVAFFIPILGVDPVPVKLPHPIRLLLVFLTMPFHAFMGVIIMGAKKLVAEEWYLGFERTWGISPERDQSWAGGILWATGDLTMFSVMSALAVQWVRDSQREARRVDRALDREEALAARRAASSTTATSTTTPAHTAAQLVSTGYDADDDPDRAGQATTSREDER
ncbi:cytochrome c oxidase assembly protein [Aestuariimicrobium ganziense]|uniref:cytochrome c oxidase assembly protein n=1 Tax=Aestuariimicrobium ganziense TaxID=2773677 RepID=UPI001F420A52|nr:cytochrome c oxidase assembly protein [Aestuariimicrobium ganziense]